MSESPTDRPATRFRVINGDTEQMLTNVLPVNNRVCIQLTPDGKDEYEEIWGEFDPYHQFTDRLDKYNVEIWEGSLIINPVTGNKDYHGEWALHEVLLKNGVWILSHVSSEKGSLDRGYTARQLLYDFDTDEKLLMFANDYHPPTELVVIGDNETNFELAQEPDWGVIHDLHQSAIARGEANNEPS